MKVRTLATIAGVVLGAPAMASASGSTDIRICDARSSVCSTVLGPAPVGVPGIASQAHALIACPSQRIPISGIGEVRVCQFTGSGRAGDYREHVGISGPLEVSVASTDAPFHVGPQSAETVTLGDQSVQIVTECSMPYTEPDDSSCVR